jgi:hypothetical protein
VQNAAKSVVVGRWNSETLRFVRKYGELLEDSSGVLGVTWFSNEEYFHVDGYIQKQDVPFYASENSTLAVANPLHPETVKVLFACASMSKYSVLCSSRVQSLEIFTSVC